MQEQGPRRSNPWPFVAITVLVLLLSVFLVLQLVKKDPSPAVVKAPAIADTPPAPPAPPAPAPAPPAPPDTAAQEAFARHLEAARKALAEKRWDDALSEIRKARGFRDAPELKGLEEEARRGSAAQAEARDQMVRAFEGLKESVDKALGKDEWERALELLRKFEADFPGALRDEPFLRLRERARKRHGEADESFNQHMAEARGHLDQGRFAGAIQSSQRAAGIYPERKAVVEEFQAGVRERMGAHQMVRIPSTPCWIGSEDAPDEKPLRQVTLPAFLIDKYEVTNGEYYAFVTAANRPAPAHWPGGQIPPQREHDPVVRVSALDAEAYARWAGKRLPTAEEWEVAARGPDRRVFPWGNEFMLKENVFHCNSLEYWQWRQSQGLKKGEGPGPLPVTHFDRANSESPWDVYGMGGNVWEWTSTEATVNGAGGSRRFRILKGGSFTTPRRAIRASNNYSENPELTFWDVGFRCARDAK